MTGVSYLWFQKNESPNKGRKKIKKLIKDDDLLEETKEAAKVEEERRKRIAERQKMVNVRRNIFTGHFFKFITVRQGGPSGWSPIIGL